MKLKNLLFIGLAAVALVNVCAMDAPAEQENFFIAIANKNPGSDPQGMMMQYRLCTIIRKVKMSPGVKVISSLHSNGKCGGQTMGTVVPPAPAIAPTWVSSTKAALTANLVALGPRLKGKTVTLYFTGHGDGGTKFESGPKMTADELRAIIHGYVSGPNAPAKIFIFHDHCDSIMQIVCDHNQLRNSPVPILQHTTALTRAMSIAAVGHDTLGDATGASTIGASDYLNGATCRAENTLGDLVGHMKAQDPIAAFGPAHTVRTNTAGHDLLKWPLGKIFPGVCKSSIADAAAAKGRAFQTKNAVQAQRALRGNTPLAKTGKLP